MTISAVINTRNEEKYIADCLESLSWVDEIVVVDMESSDKTTDICYRFTKNVFKHKFLPYVEPARNFGLKQATGDWIILLDPDERIPHALAAKLIQIVKEDAVNFVRIPRKNIIFDHPMHHSRWWPDYNVRFFKKGKVEWQNAIHRPPLTLGEGLTLPEDEELAIVHYNYTSILEYFDKFHRYAAITARQLQNDGYQFDWTDLLKRPFSEFLSRFFAGQGYKDGLHGLVISLLQAFQEMTIYLLVWEKQGFTPENGRPFIDSLIQSFRKLQHEFNYWLTTLLIENASKKTAKFWLRLKRRFV